MNRTDEPKKQPVVFGVNGQRETLLPTTPAGDNTASYDAGFPPVTMILKAAGGLPPKGQDMNQILFELSALSRWFSAGAIAGYDATFSTAIGGYPKGAEVVGSDGTTRYLNTVDANTTNPNTGGAGWFNLTTGYLQAANNLSDIPSVPAALANLGLGTGLTGIVGATRNAAMSIATASASATFTADELIVETSAGTQYRLNAFNKTINLATTGAGGMDTGTAPASGYVALYAIYNPTTSASALLAVNATSAKVPEIYGGSNAPSGYTASALVSVWPIVASQMVIGYQNDRDIFPAGSLAINGTVSTTVQTVITLASSSFPYNSKQIAGYTTVSAANGQTAEAWILTRPVLSQGLRFAINAASLSVGIGMTFPFSKIPILNPGTIYYAAFASNTSTFGLGVNITGYSI